MILVTVTTSTGYHEVWVKDEFEAPLTMMLEGISDRHPANTYRATDMGRPSTII